MLRLVLSNKFKKDLKRSKKRGKDLNKLYSIITKLQRNERYISRKNKSKIIC